MDEWRRSGQIPAFGDWEKANEMPITQYFECARQAGLIRYSSSSGEYHDHQQYHGYKTHGYTHDLYAVPDQFHKHSRNLYAPNSNRKMREGKEKRVSQAKNYKEHVRKQGKVFDVNEPTRKHHVSHNFKDSGVRPVRPKAVDEDLYKIPPELLRSSKRKKGFFSCLVPACAS